MRIIHRADEMQKWSLTQRRQGLRLGFVPTMGYLHKGHLDLMTEALKHSDRTIASIFINPAQFNNPADLKSYPRNEKGDLEGCESSGCSVVFYPDVEQIYPKGFSTRVEVDKLTDHLCGSTRPGHFEGVALVVAKLFNLVLPDVAVFGEKDYQQLAIIRRMTEDLNFPVRIIGHPTVREADGMAMSSRNARLTKDERRRAVALSQALFAAGDAFRAGKRDPQVLIADAKSAIEASAPDAIDYIQIVDADTLQPVDSLDKPAIMALAAQYGQSRLIDNILLAEP